MTSASSGTSSPLPYPNRRLAVPRPPEVLVHLLCDPSFMEPASFITRECDFLLNRQIALMPKTVTSVDTTLLMMQMTDATRWRMQLHVHDSLAEKGIICQPREFPVGLSTVPLMLQLFNSTDQVIVLKIGEPFCVLRAIRLFDFLFDVDSIFSDSDSDSGMSDDSTVSKRWLRPPTSRRVAATDGTASSSSEVGFDESDNSKTAKTDTSDVIFAQCEVESQQTVQ